MEEEREIVIVGAGIAGLATALALKKLGVQDLVVLERSNELRTTGAALTLFPNAWRALDALGVARKLISICEPFVLGSVINIETGQKFGMGFTQGRGQMGGGMGARTVHRKLLLEALAEELPSDTIRFSSKLASIKSEVSKESSTITIMHLEDGTIIKTKVLIGCDGVQSVVAQWLGLSAPIDSGRWSVRGVAVYKDGHGLKKEVTQFLSRGKRAGIVPLNDHDIYWFLHKSTMQRGLLTSTQVVPNFSLPTAKKEIAKDFARDPSLILKEVINNLAKEFPQAYLDVVQHSNLSSLSWAPLMFRAPWAVIFGPNHKGTVTVAGDSMHPMTPDLGQGGCSALEDAIVLVRNIGHALSSDGKITSQKSTEDGIENYVKERRWRVASLIVASYLSGWVQEGGSGPCAWAVRFLRDHVFYRFCSSRFTKVVEYDCGVLSPVRQFDSLGIMVSIGSVVPYLVKLLSMIVVFSLLLFIKEYVCRQYYKLEI